MKTWQQPSLSLCVFVMSGVAAQAKQGYCYSAELAAAQVGRCLVDFSHVTRQKKKKNQQ